MQQTYLKFLTSGIPPHRTVMVSLFEDFDLLYFLLEEAYLMVLNDIDVQD